MPSRIRQRLMGPLGKLILYYLTVVDLAASGNADF
jgi:hypothetical protein